MNRQLREKRSSRGMNSRSRDTSTSPSSRSTKSSSAVASPCSSSRQLPTPNFSEEEWRYSGYRYNNTENDPNSFHNYHRHEDLLNLESLKSKEIYMTAIDQTESLLEFLVNIEGEVDKESDLNKDLLGRISGRTQRNKNIVSSNSLTKESIDIKRKSEQIITPADLNRLSRQFNLTEYFKN